MSTIHYSPGVRTPKKKIRSTGGLTILNLNLQNGGMNLRRKPQVVCTNNCKDMAIF